MPFRKSKPGETPLDDISGLKIKGLQTQSERNEVEAQNILKATVKYLAGNLTRTVAPFDLPWVFKLHNEMFGDVWTWAGERRQTNLNIGIPWEQIETSLQQLLDNLDYQEQHGTNLMEQAVMLHYRAVFIHPFRDGNGRWSRMLANIWLRLHGQNIVAWPTEISGSDSVIRQEYLAAIRLANDGDYDSLTELHRRFAQSEYPWKEIRRPRRQQPRPRHRRPRRP